MNRITSTAVAAILVVFAAATATSVRAQAVPAANGMVTGNGTATIQRLPDVLRVRVDMPADGKDAREAIASLRAQEKTAREKLASLGAAADSVTLSPPRVVPAGGSGATGQQAMIERMIRARTGRGGDKAATTSPAGAASVRVVATLTAEWSLKAQARDERIAEATDLQAKVKAASIVTVAPRELTPEEQEEAEENAGMMFDMQNGAPAPGEPTFVFVAKLSEEDRAKAMAEAFEEAKADAARLSKAANVQLGALHQLSGTAAAYDEASENDPNNWNAMMYAAMQQQQRPARGAASEAVGTQPGNVSYRVTVAASFALGQR